MKNQQDRCSPAGRLRMLALCAPALLALAACGGGGGGGDTPPAPAVAVAVSPGTTTVKVDQTQQFTATVTNAANTAVDWTVSGAGCSGAACGAISAAGLYTAPSILPIPPEVSVKATARADTTKSASAAITLGSDVAVEIWPQQAMVTVGGSRQFLRLVTGHANEAVTWSASGAGCTGTACGTVSADGQYSAPNAVPGNGIVTLRATSVVDTSRSTTAQITVLANDDAKLNGGYVYLYRGVADVYGAVAAGAFVALGNGVIGSGALDSSTGLKMGGTQVDRAFTGTYSVGTDNRGALSFVYPGGGTDELRTSLAASGERGFIQLFSGNYPFVRGNGELHKQHMPAAGNAAISGDYVFQLDGADESGRRIANLGRFSANGTGTISGGLIDSTDGTTLTENVPFTGSYSVSQNGRAATQLTIGGVAFNFAIYVVSADRLVLVSTDALAAGTPIRVGYALRQAGAPFANASLQGNHVFSLTGRRSATAAVATTGLLASDGAGSLSGMLDRNDNYTFTAGLSWTGTYAIAANGRGTLVASDLPAMIFYVTGRGDVLLMEGAGASVQTGLMQRQAAAPYSTAHLMGQFAAGSTPPLRLASLTVTGQTIYGGPGNAASALDIASPCALQPNASSSGAVSVSPAGRITVRDPAGVQQAGGYLISPAQYFMTLERATGDATCDEVVHNYIAEQ